jgi:hypoxanthine phosphoribosyltransferase
MEYLRFSWEEAESSVRSLSAKITSSGFRPHIIVAISRGGLVPARLFSDVLNVPLLYTIRISFYSSVGVNREKPEITQPLSVDISGKKVLIVDDISDSGKSLALADRYVESLHPSEVKTASIHYRPTSIFRPDFFHATTTAWIVYPWEKDEFFRETGKRADSL